MKGEKEKSKKFNKSRSDKLKKKKVNRWKIV